MDPTWFDRLTRLVVTAGSRRALGGAVLGSLAGLLGPIPAKAAPCPRGKKRCRTKCIPKRQCCTTAACRPAATGKVCRRGRCVCPASRKPCGQRCIPKAACCGGCLPGQVCQGGTCCFPTTAAFQTALAPGGPAVIQLCPGTAYTGNFVLGRNVTVIGAGPTSTILSGSGALQVVEVASDVTAELQGLQITNSRMSSGLTVRGRAFVTLRGCLVRGNTAAGGGGGFASVGTLVLIDTVVSGNSARFGGAGLLGDSGGAFANTLVLLGTTRVEGNQASDQGGGLWMSGTRITVQLRDDSIVTGNRAAIGVVTSGGGIYNDPAFPGSIVFFDRSRVTGNLPNNCTGVTCPS